MHLIDDKPELWPYVLASILIHALLIAFLPQVISQTPRFDEKPIEVFAVPAVSPPAGKTPYEIADIEKPAVEERPKSAKFMGLYDTATNEEQVGIGHVVKKVGEEGRGKGRRSPREAKRENAPKPKTGGGRLFAFDKNLFNSNSAKAVEKEEGGGGAAGALDDFYPDFRRGAHTYLNVLRYPEVAYFVRLKHAFKVAFNPIPSLSDYFSRNRVTRGSIDVVLGVSVNRGGNLAELFVFRSSGIPAYDEEALRTIRVSAPFSTPPEKFLADDGLLRMSWTFSVYL